uniref:Uncharacterized protein n=1 Tax=Leptocylindrus danicus TaxID=163516 RepID=A0A7S2LH60_9STRA|mmetsp:Transcript_5013/g.7360  ORF Transcript_5013/g.7360 Transcript_5013/m.7360 type:complete len:120 (+) Transcript_5013:40-399(+)
MLSSLRQSLFRRSYGVASAGSKLIPASIRQFQMKSAAAPALYHPTLFPNFQSPKHCSIGYNNMVTSQQPVAIVLPDEGEINMLSRILQAMNRNARKGKRANKGKRPCSRIRRRAKKKRN